MSDSHGDLALLAGSPSSVQSQSTHPTTTQEDQLMVKVSIDTDVEMYPVVSIRTAQDDHGFEVPDELMDTYDAACEAVVKAEEAILRAAGYRLDPRLGWHRP